VHRKDHSKCCQTVAGEQKRGVAREVALREEGGCLEGRGRTWKISRCWSG